ncbi:MAG: hypothetical protein L0228_01455 [Planctomycetes bacterium]|nr:hypothetical protein [Planctomycetota bacterium]
MKRIMSNATLSVAAIIFSVLAARDAAAAQITLNLVQADSNITVTGVFGGLPFVPQDSAPVQAGTTDLNPASPSNKTTFQGTITIDVNNVNAPSSIQFLSSNADADVSGLWMSRAFDNPGDNNDLNGNGIPYEFGAPPGGDSSPAAGSPPGPADPGDWGFRVRHPAFGVTLATGVSRDIVFNITSPAIPVAGGMFSSLTENFEFATGWLDYWVAPAAGNLQGRAELAGGDTDNSAAASSSYIVTPLPFNQRQITLTIPVDIDNPGSDADFYYDGTLVATLIVPEPSGFVLLGIGSIVAAFVGRRMRK